MALFSLENTGWQFGSTINYSAFFSSGIEAAGTVVAGDSRYQTDGVYYGPVFDTDIIWLEPTYSDTTLQVAYVCPNAYGVSEGWYIIDTTYTDIDPAALTPTSPPKVFFVSHNADFADLRSQATRIQANATLLYDANTRFSIDAAALGDISYAINEKITPYAAEFRAYSPAEMPDAIRSIESGRSELIPKTITANGIYWAIDDDADGYYKVTVAVPTPLPLLQNKTVTENGTVTADSDYDGLNRVVVAIPYYEGW